MPRAAPRLGAALAAALLLLGCGGEPAAAPAALARLELLDAPQRGPADAWVTIVEFSDFQCPYCGLAQPTLEQLLRDFPADVRLVFKHYPLSFHANARAAAVAAECARAQGPRPDGLFWELHDRLFATQASWGPASPAGAAATFELQVLQVSGLDLDAWLACALAADQARIDADLAQGRTVPVPGTPTLVVNGVVQAGAGPFETFYPALRATVEAARAAAIASGLPRDQYYQRAVLGR